MTDASANTATGLYATDAHIRKRNAAEKRFRLYGLAAVCVGILALIVLMTSILGNGVSAFRQTYVTLNVELLEAKLDKNGNRNIDDIKKVSTFGYSPLIQAGVEAAMAENGIEIEGLTGK
ncbi:MAG: DUF3333 domain-containing protein, partial [Pseudomonadota bacterium]|nr:DUF3333 domain-containing protein [Pseudomonadota bacterium]